METMLQAATQAETLTLALPKELTSQSRGRRVAMSSGENLENRGFPLGYAA
ncbi:MAG: hypothetical protein HC925_01015 [Coleofasciculaceae cyanobacterium SM2_3_26]|nr:hypothetical protein [Coleofasciculaceae cyanobacterium SM2_3_26]